MYDLETIRVLNRAKGRKNTARKTDFDSEYVVDADYDRVRPGELAAAVASGKVLPAEALTGGAY